MGVTTVALVYDSRDHVPVKYPGPDTTLPAEGVDASESSHDVKEGAATNLLCEGSDLHKGPMSNGPMAKEVTVMVKMPTEYEGSGYACANHCSWDVTPLC